MADKPTGNTFSSTARIPVAELNENFDTLATAIEGCLGRGGTGESPNSMEGNLDMDTNRIINLGDPINDQDAATKKFIEDNYGAASTSAAAASAAAAAASATAAAASADFVDDLYLGAKASAPTTDNDGDAIITGALYYNTTDGKTYVWTSGGSWTEAYTPAGAVPSATTSVEGIIEIATDAEALAETATNKALVPSNLAARTDIMRNNTAQTLSAGVTCDNQVLAAGGSATPDFNLENIMTWSVTATGTLNNPSNKDSGVFHLVATIDATGGYTTTFDTDYNIVSGTWDSTANAVNIVTMVCDGTTVYCYIAQGV